MLAIWLSKDEISPAATAAAAAAAAVSEAIVSDNSVT